VNYDELAGFMWNMPRIPRRELKCHPAVIIALQAQEKPEDPVTPLALGIAITGIPVYVDLTLGWGEWHLKEDDLTVASGVLCEGSSQ
jgi:hypothetical protein